jgi:hypothetical protein
MVERSAKCFRLRASDVFYNYASWLTVTFFACRFGLAALFSACRFAVQLAFVLQLVVCVSPLCTLVRYTAPDFEKNVTA